MRMPEKKEASHSKSLNQECTLVLLKPDCIERGLVPALLARLTAHFEIVAIKDAVVTEDQVLTHYGSLVRRLGGYAGDALRDMYVGKCVKAVILRGPDVIVRARLMAGSSDPAKASQESIRGLWGVDSFRRARRERRLVENLIHVSASEADVSRELAIWFSSTEVVELGVEPYSGLATLESSFQSPRRATDSDGFALPCND